MTGRSKYFLLFLLLLFGLFHAKGQDCDSLAALLSDFKLSEFEATLEVELSAKEVYGSEIYADCSDQVLKADIAYAFGLKYFNLPDDEKALLYFNKALHYRLDSLKLDEAHDDVIKCKINIGRCLQYSNQLGKARSVLESCFAVKDQMELPKTHGRMLFHLGEIYLEMGIYDRAADCFGEVIELTNNGEESLFFYMVHAYNLMGIALSENAQYVASYESFKQFGEEFLSEDEPDFVVYLYNSAKCLEWSNQHEEALVLYERLEEMLAQDHLQKVFGEAGFNAEMCRCMLGQARILTTMTRTDEARGQIQQASRYCSGKLTIYYDNLADLELENGELESALNYYHQALVNGFEIHSQVGPVLQLPDLVVDRPDQLQLRNLLEITRSFGSTAYAIYLKTNEFAYLERAYEAYDLYDKIFLLNFEQLLTDDSRYRLIEIARPAFEEAINVSFKLHDSGDRKKDPYAQKAFYFAERIRANLLYTSISNKDALEEKLVPDEAKVQIENLLSEIRRLDEQVSSSDRMPSRDSLDNLVNGLEIRLDHEKSKLAEAYPAYYQLAFNNRDIPGFQDLRQQILGKNRTLIEYFVSNNDSSIYIFGIGPDRDYFQQVRIPSGFRDRTLSFLKSISDRAYIFDRNRDAWPVYFQQGQELYELLLKDALTELGAEDGELLIIPDDVLNLIPFATLLTGPANDFYTAPYLLRQYAVSYDYSAKSLLRNYRQSDKRETYTACGFAPTYVNNPDWGELNFNSKELTALTSNFNDVRIFDREAASRPAFEAVCGECDILHISGHGSLDEKETLKNHLVFYREEGTSVSEMLTVSRIHLQDLPARLTVLSSCNSAMGDLRSNEGLVSVSNAFSYAGSRSVMASLWLLNDKQAHIMMKSFYGLIKEGRTTAEALSESQLAVIKSSPVNSHPYFWGNLMLIGNTDPLFYKTESAWYLRLAGGVLLLLLLGWLTVRKRKS
ncbi:MAG: CHAT domain-containing protein [Bacteroidetes bacterium]|nr:CHAT domain-containing protein [Bacteroidota bacterium]